jgi:hypothetical protein
VPTVADVEVTTGGWTDSKESVAISGCGRPQSIATDCFQVAQSECRLSGVEIAGVAVADRPKPEVRIAKFVAAKQPVAPD